MLRRIILLFVLFCLQLIANNTPLPLLVKDGEPLLNNESLYIPLKKPINTICITSNGKYIVSGSNKYINIWDIKTGELLKTLIGHNKPVSSVSITPDNTKIISGSYDKTIKIWDMKSGKLLKTLKGHQGSVTSIAITPDNTKIISGSYDKTIKIWDLKTGKLLKTLIGHQDYVTCIKITNNNKYIVSASWDNTIRIWDLKTGKPLNILTGHNGTIYTVKVDNFSNTIISGSYDKTIKIWDLKSGELLKTLTGHQGYITSIAITPDNTKIISGSSDRTIKIWDLKTELCLKTLKGHSSDIYSLAITPDNTKIISGSSDNTIKIWDLKNGQLLNILTGHNGHITSIAITPDNTKIISGSSDKTIKIWDLKSGELLQTLKGHISSVTSVAANNKKVISGSVDRTIRIWDIKTGELLKKLWGHNGSITSIAITPDNTKIISSSNDNTIRIWDLNRQKLLKILWGSKKTKFLTVISSKEKIFSGSNDDSIKLWDLKTGNLLKKIKCHSSTINTLTLTHDNKYIIAGFQDGYIEIRDRATGKLAKNLVGSSDGCWINIDYVKSKFYRGDNGTLLFSNNHNKLHEIFPPDYNSTQKDNFSAFIGNKNISIQNGKKRKLDIFIKNKGNKDIYFLNLFNNNKQCAIKQKRIDKLIHNTIKELQTILSINSNKLNPKPKDINCSFAVVSGNGKQVNYNFKVKVLSPYITIKKAKISQDGKNLNILVLNSGNLPLSKAYVKMTQPFNADEREITNLDINGSKTLSFSLPNDINKSQKLEINFYIKNDKETKINNANTPISSLYNWHYKNIDIEWSVNNYTYFFIVLFMLILLILIYYYQLYQNPLVVKLTQNPDSLKTLSPKELQEANKKLKKINRLNTILQLSKIEKNNFDLILKFINEDANNKAKLFAKHIDFYLEKEEDGFYKIIAKDNFTLDKVKNFLLYISNKPLFEIENKVKDINDKVFILTNHEEQDKMAKLAHDKTNRIIAPTLEELTSLMLSTNSQEKFISILSNCLSFKDISPYQINGDVKSEDNFFGRVDILREIISNDSSNFLIVGARQLGKSSILKALERRYKRQKNRECFLITLDERGNIIKSIALLLNMDNDATIDDIVSKIKKMKKKPIFLIDEADKFILHEKENSYIVTSVFRKLSQEDYATFILAGFWTLYEHITLDYQSPLKNFGKIKIIKGLEEDACRDLMIKPMEKIGISYEDNSIIEKTIKLCGYRANYIAIICDEILQHLTGNTIKHSDLDWVLEESDIVDRMLQGWGNISSCKESNRLDRLIVYLNITKDNFRKSDVVSELKKYDLHIDIDKINQSLDRLGLAYVLKNSNHTYSFCIPLFKNRLLKDDLEILIEGEVDLMKHTFN